MHVHVRESGDDTGDISLHSQANVDRTPHARTGNLRYPITTTTHTHMLTPTHAKKLVLTQHSTKHKHIHTNNYPDLLIGIFEVLDLLEEFGIHRGQFLSEGLVFGLQGGHLGGGLVGEEVINSDHGWGG